MNDKRGSNNIPNIKFKKKKAQVWVETVIYTLIGLTIIGLLLAVSKTAFDEQKDKALIEQAINGLGRVDEKMYEVLGGTGNKRKLELKIGSGQFIIDGETDKIVWELDSHFEYSEENVIVKAGKLNITTSPGSPWKVTLEMGTPFDIQFKGQSIKKPIGESPTPHVITIENLGTPGGKTVINFNEI
jgi:hypothetical protein